MKFFKLSMASRDINRSPKAAICFGKLDFSLDDEGEAVRAPESRPPPPRSLGTAAGANDAPRIDYTPRATIHFGNLDFVINKEGDMVRAALARPPPPENLDTVSEALGGLSLAPSIRRKEHRPAPPFEADEIRRHIAIHMEHDPTYDDMSVFFESYTELSALYDVETSSYYGGSSNDPGAFPRRLCCAPAVIAALVAYSHLSTCDDLEFAWMVDGGEDLIFDAHCTDLNSNSSTPVSSEEEPPNDNKDEDCMTYAGPSAVRAKWGSTHWA
jgi:hypothetical protein